MDREIRVALIGVGNCASALLQGLHYYSLDDKSAVGVNKTLAGYSLESIKVSAAFDVHSEKVGIDVADAIFTPPNCVERIAQPLPTGTKVLRGPLLDGVDQSLSDLIPVTQDAIAADVQEVLGDTRTDVVVNLLPSGAKEATNHYVLQSLRSKCAVINAIPVDVLNDPQICKLAIQQGVPIIGDDIKSQLGATVIHKSLAELFPQRQGLLESTLQFDWGGDSDFHNLVVGKRYDDGKRRSKTEAVVWNQPNKVDMDAQVSAIAYVPFLGNTKEAYARLDGRIFGNRPVRVQVFINVPDAYNSAGVLVDAIRVAAAAKQARLAGPLDIPSAVYCKRPRQQTYEATAAAALVDFLQCIGDGRQGP